MFEHDDAPIKGIKNKNFLKFDIDADLNWLDDEICGALASADLSKIPMVAGEQPPNMYEGRPGFEYSIPPEIKMLRPEFDSDMEFRRFLIFKGYAEAPWVFVVDVKPNMFRTKSQDLNDWNDIASTMPYTKKIIQSLPFKEIGRVVIYGSWADSIVPCHRDQPTSNEINHHINFTPGGPRPIYLYDCPSETKHYLPEDHIFHAYNVTDYHGVDAMPRFSYTVRVDGVYEDGIL